MIKKTFGSKRPTIKQLQDSFNLYAPKNLDPAKLPAFMHEKAREPSTKRRKHEEHDSQTEVVRYLHNFCPAVLVASSLNGELWPMSQHIDKGRFFGWMNKLKNRGMLPGDADLRLTWSPSRCIFIEKKRSKGGKLEIAQIEVGDRLRAQGFSVYVMEGGIEELKEIIIKEKIPCIDYSVK